jgi:hypothetical protein
LYEQKLHENRVKRLNLKARRRKILLPQTLVYSEFMGYLLPFYLHLCSVKFLFGEKTLRLKTDAVVNGSMIEKPGCRRKSPARGRFTKRKAAS